MVIKSFYYGVSTRYIGFTKDNLGVHPVFETTVKLGEPILTLKGLTDEIKLYKIGLLTDSRISDVRPIIIHK
jgi:hypothetical protein